MCGGSLVVLAGVVGVLLALPISWTDDPGRYPDLRSKLPWTPYPSMLPVLVAVLAAAGLVAALRPATARVTAVIAGLAALQVGGIAVVAHRDWWNFAGAGGADYDRAAFGSLATVVMGVAAVAAVAVSVLLYRTGTGVDRPRLTQVVGAMCAGAVIVVLVPVVLCMHWYYTRVTAAGQFALWWSLPWGVGIVAAGTLPNSAARQAAALSVLGSALLALLCLAAPVIYGFGIRLPD
jgi:hypothetical protein